MQWHAFGVVSDGEGHLLTLDNDCGAVFRFLCCLLAALAVMSRGMRPEIPQHTPAGLAALMQVRHNDWLWGDEALGCLDEAALMLQF